MICATPAFTAGAHLLFQGVDPPAVLALAVPEGVQRGSVCAQLGPHLRHVPVRPAGQVARGGRFGPGLCHLVPQLRDVLFEPPDPALEIPASLMEVMLRRRTTATGPSRPSCPQPVCAVGPELCVKCA